MVRTVPEWAFEDAAFTRHGNDLVIEAADGGVWVVSGYYVNGARPDLQSLTGETLSPEMIAARVGMGRPVQVAQAAQADGPQTDAPPQNPADQSPIDPQATPADTVPEAASSLEQLLLSLSAGGGLEANAGMLQVFQAAAREALGENATPEQLAAMQQAFIDALQGGIAFGDSPTDALEAAKAVFTNPPPSGPSDADSPEGQAGNLLQALASGQGAGDLVEQLAAQAAGGEAVDPEQAALAAQAFIEGLGESLAEGELPVEALALADQLFGDVADGVTPTNEGGPGDALLQALASGENAT
ncbi:MAG: hypothetical protein HOH04_09745, partial [Rhodospirillaceae bacterium]|nr:hypothetical protein [Rhodospirillaceae bacterium]